MVIISTTVIIKSNRKPLTEEERKRLENQNKASCCHKIRQHKTDGLVAC
jgi:hypothetical protein